MTLPNGAAGLATQGLEFAFTNDGSIPGAVDRVQSNIEAILKGEMQQSPGWLGAAGVAFSGLPAGVPLILGLVMKMAQQITGLPIESWGEPTLEKITEVFNGIGTFFARLTSMFGAGIDFMVEGIWDAGEAIVGWIEDVLLGTGLLASWNNLQELINKIWTGIFQEGLPTGVNILIDQLSDAFHNIPPLNVLGLAAGTIVDTFQDIVDQLFRGFSRNSGASGKSILDVAAQAGGTALTAEGSRDLSEWNNAVLGIRNNKGLMQGMDETEESNFLMDTMFDGGVNPPIVSATAANVPISFWLATEDANKGFISWFGRGFTGITSLFIDIYKFNFDTSTMELIHTSPNQIGMVTASWQTLVYYLDPVDRFQVVHGEVYGVAWRVVGAGTHEIAGKLSPWLPAHPTKHPQKPAASRTGSGDLAFGSISYSGDVGWFGIGIVDGDTPPPFFAPRQEAFTDVGPYAYTIPPWANFIDCVYLSGAGGGCGGHPITTAHGEGGDAGVWVSETLVRGVDFPVDAIWLGFNIGAGGEGGPGNTAGSAGEDTYRVAIPSGKAMITAAGGAGGNNQTSPAKGDSPGDFTYGGITHMGGEGGSSHAAQDGYPGGRGAGGGGGAGGTWGVAWGGGDGGSGGAWVNARQS